MAKELRELHFEFKASEPKGFPVAFQHYGVVGSGDMEVIMEGMPLNGAARIKVVTPVGGYDHVWERVLEKFVEETGVGDVSLEINDNNATPVVVSMRLRQALVEALPQGGKP